MLLGYVLDGARVLCMLAGSSTSSTPTVHPHKCVTPNSAMPLSVIYNALNYRSVRGDIEVQQASHVGSHVAGGTDVVAPAQ